MAFKKRIFTKIMEISSPVSELPLLPIFFIENNANCDSVWIRCDLACLEIMLLFHEKSSVKNDLLCFSICTFEVFPLKVAAVKIHKRRIKSVKKNIPKIVCAHFGCSVFRYISKAEFLNDVKWCQQVYMYILGSQKSIATKRASTT